jgi:hypothetical protein
MHIGWKAPVHSSVVLAKHRQHPLRAWRVVPCQAHHVVGHQLLGLHALTAAAGGLTHLRPERAACAMTGVRATAPRARASEM